MSAAHLSLTETHTHTREAISHLSVPSHGRTKTQLRQWNLRLIAAAEEALTNGAPRARACAHARVFSQMRSAHESLRQMI